MHKGSCTLHFPFLYDQLRVWIERIEPNPAALKAFLAQCVTQESDYNCAFVFGYAASVIYALFRGSSCLMCGRALS